MVPIFCTFCVQLGKPFPGLLKSGVFKCHPRDHPSYCSLCPTRSIFIANCFLLLRAFILCPSFCLPAYFLSLHPVTLRVGTSGTAMVSLLACQTLSGNHKLLLKISLVSLCLCGWVWGDFCRLCKVFIINHRITVLAESHTNSFFFLQFVFSHFSLLLSFQLFPLFKFIWIIINAS